VDQIEAAAANLADWHECSLRALGRTTRRTDTLWSCDSGPAVIYLQAITLGPNLDFEARRADLGEFVKRRAGEPVGIADVWDSLNLGSSGYRPSAYGPNEDWFWRPAGPTGDPPEGIGLEVSRATDEDELAVFEETSLTGMGSEDRIEEYGRLGIHGSGVLDDPRMHALVGRVDGRPVTAAMAYVSDNLVGIYGVGTLPAYRRRGYGDAITRAAVAVAPHLPAMLSPSDMARSMYAKVGFQQIGSWTKWVPGIGK